MAHEDEVGLDGDDLEVGNVLEWGLHYFIVIYWSTLNRCGLGNGK